MVEDEILSKYATAMTIAAREAVHISTSWGAPCDDGGMAWSTYRATCVREYVPLRGRRWRDLLIAMQRCFQWNQRSERPEHG